MLRLFVSILAVVVLAACMPGQPFTWTEPPQVTPPDGLATSPPEQPMAPPVSETHPYAPRAGDEKLMWGNVYIDSAQLLSLESYPLQFVLALAGSLPTPCNELRAVVNPPDEHNRIQVEVYSLVDPDQICIQMLKPFSVSISLGSFPTGHYTLWVNGEQAGELDA